MGEKKHINKIPPKIPGQSRENFVYVFFSLCVFLLPKNDYLGQIILKYVCFARITILTRNLLNCSFSEISRAQEPSKIPKK